MSYLFVKGLFVELDSYLVSFLILSVLSWRMNVQHVCMYIRIYVSMYKWRFGTLQ